MNHALTLLLCRYVRTCDPALGPSSQPRLVGLRRVYLCPVTGAPAEETLPRTTTSSSSVFPFPHGLDSPRAPGAGGVVLVSSVLDSVALAASSSSSSSSGALAAGFLPVALAEGTSSLPPDHLPFLEGFEKVAIWCVRFGIMRREFFFFRHLGCLAFGVHHPTWPLSGGRTLDTSLRPRGGVWGCLGSKLCWGGTGI